MEHSAGGRAAPDHSRRGCLKRRQATSPPRRRRVSPGHRPGERALFTVPPELGYGEEGSFSFPSVPPACWLLADVELIGVKRADEEPMARADMLYEERMQRVKAHRQRGNGFFRGGEPEAAAREYEMALSFLTDDMMMQLHGEYLRAADGEKLSAHLNLCACALKLGKKRASYRPSDAGASCRPKKPEGIVQARQSKTCARARR